MFQVILHVLVFIFYSFDRENPEFNPLDVVFFLNYAAAVMIIDYYLFPKYLYQNKYGAFFLQLGLLIVLVIFVEEYILEQLFYPETRGSRFTGFFIGMLDVLPVIAILSGFKLAWDVIRKQREVEELRASVKDSELSFLKSQINPHFLFNNLNNLYAYALENSSKTPTIILELSSVLRYMLYECSEEYVPLHKELEQLKNYVRLNTLQIEERGEIELDLPESTPGAYKIAPLIFMVFIENAFKHSMASLAEQIQISISIHLEKGNTLVFNCENDYRQISNNEKVAQGIGLENVKKRLEYLYPESHELHIDDSNDRFKVELRLELT